MSVLAFYYRGDLKNTIRPYLPVSEAELRSVARNNEIEQQLLLLEQRTRDEKVQREKEHAIGQLLDKAATHFRAGRIIAPTGENALETYLRILENHAENEGALAGKERIYQHYLKTAVKLVSEENFDAAESALKRADVIKPDSTAVKLARVALTDTRAETEHKREEEKKKRLAALEIKRRQERMRQAELEQKRKEEERSRLEAERIVAQEAERKRLEEEDRIKIEEERQQKYDSYIRQADAFMNEESFDNAVRQYQLAIELYPGDNTAQQGIVNANGYKSACTEIIGKWHIKPNGITWKIKEDNTVHGTWLIFSADGNWECLSARQREFVIRWPTCAVCITEHFFLTDDGNSLNASRGAVSSGIRTE